MKDERPDTDEISLDQATRGVTGSPDIARIIFDKILNASVFVGDVSIINSHLKPTDLNVKFRATPNPNVLTELGYAARHLDWCNVILIFNSAYGSEDDVPFDIRNHLRMNYCATESDEVADARSDLAQRLKDAIQAIANRFESDRARSLTIPLKRLLSELEYNSYALEKDWKKGGLRFETTQFEKLNKQGTLHELPVELRNALLDANNAVTSVNRRMELRDTPSPGLPRATINNLVGESLSEAKPKIEKPVMN